MTENNKNEYDTIIVGGGVSGLTAGIYAGRAGLNTIIIEGDYNSSTDMPGGQLMLTLDIENFPGFPSGSGEELIEIIRTQAQTHVARIITQNAEKFSFSESGLHTVSTEDETYTAKTVILATGSVAKRLGVPGEDELFSKGVSTCATCDGAFFANKTVAVVGGGDTAVEDALYLAGIAKKVYVIHRGSALRANSPESRNLETTENVEILWNSRVKQVNGSVFVESATLINEAGEYDLELDGLFVAIGHNPATERLQGHPIEVNDFGYIVARDTETNIKGVYVAGDVADSKYRQAITAAATGAMASMNAIRHLKSI